jgi:hypothetical protein
VEIALSGKRGARKFVIVDSDDFEKFGHLRWHLSDTGYATRKNGKVQKLHRLIMGNPVGMVVDHLNGNKLDCRKSNLRVCTPAENSRNRHDIVGVSFDRSRGKYMARHRRKFCGRYETKEEALRAYQLAKSGQEYQPKQRQKYMLPKHIYRQNGKWGYGFSVDGVRYRRNGFATLALAQEALKLQKERIGL